MLSNLVISNDVDHAALIQQRKRRNGQPVQKRRASNNVNLVAVNNHRGDSLHNEFLNKRRKLYADFPNEIPPEELGNYMKQSMTILMDQIACLSQRVADMEKRINPETPEVLLKFYKGKLCDGCHKLFYDMMMKAAREKESCLHKIAEFDSKQKRKSFDELLKGISFNFCCVVVISSKCRIKRGY